MATEPWQLGGMKIRPGDLVLKANEKSMSGQAIVQELLDAEECEITIWRRFDSRESEVAISPTDAFGKQQLSTKPEYADEYLPADGKTEDGSNSGEEEDDPNVFDDGMPDDPDQLIGND